MVKRCFAILATALSFAFIAGVTAMAAPSVHDPSITISAPDVAAFEAFEAVDAGKSFVRNDAGCSAMTTKAGFDAANIHYFKTHPISTTAANKKASGLINVAVYSHSRASPIPWC